MLNQSRKVANLSDQGKVLPRDVCVECFLCDGTASQYKTKKIWGSGAVVELCVTDAMGRLEWFLLSLKPMGSGCSMTTGSCVVVVVFSGASRRKWFPLSLKPMGSACLLTYVTGLEVLDPVDEQGKASSVFQCVPPFSQNSNFTEEFELGYGLRGKSTGVVCKESMCRRRCMRKGQSSHINEPVCIQSSRHSVVESSKRIGSAYQSLLRAWSQFVGRCTFFGSTRKETKC